MAQNAATYSPQDAIQLVSAFGHGIPLASVQAQLCDIINTMIWVYYPWSWTIKSLTPIATVDGTQDYTPTDTDILRPVKLRLTRTDTTPNESREMMLLSNLSIELSRKAGIDTMKAIAWYASTNILRTDLAIGLAPTQTIQIQGEYQKLPTKITPTNLSTIFQMPDRFFNVFIEGLKWKVYQLSDDPRAGGATTMRNGKFDVNSSGQYGMFINELMKAARTEDLSQGDEFMYPESPIGLGHAFWPGMFGVAQS